MQVLNHVHNFNLLFSNLVRLKLKSHLIQNISVLRIDNSSSLEPIVLPKTKHLYPFFLILPYTQTTTRNSVHHDHSEKNRRYIGTMVCPKLNCYTLYLQSSSQNDTTNFVVCSIISSLENCLENLSHFFQQINHSSSSLVLPTTSYDYSCFTLN